MALAAKFTHTVWKRACVTAAMYRARGIHVYIKPYEKGYGVFSSGAQLDKWGNKYGHNQILHTADWYCGVWVPSWRKAVNNGSEIVLVQRATVSAVSGTTSSKDGVPQDEYDKEMEELIALESEDGSCHTVENEEFVN